MDEDDDQPLPQLIGQFQKEDDANSTNSRTVVFSNIDDAPAAPPQGTNVVIPPLQTPYTGGFAPAVHYIEIENARWSVPYQTAPLDPTARCDSITQNDNRLSQSHCQYAVSKDRVAQAMEDLKQWRNDGLSLFYGGANGGIAGRDMRPMDDPHSSDCFATIYGNTYHEINNKYIGRYCAVSPSKEGDVVCIYPEYARVLEQPASIHSGTQLQDYGNWILDFSTLLGGGQSIIAPLGHIFPLIILGGLSYLPQRLPIDCKMISLPQVLMTLSKPWDPSIFYTKCTIEELLCSLPAIPAGTREDLSDKEGNLVLASDVDWSGDYYSWWLW